MNIEQCIKQEQERVAVLNLSIRLGVLHILQNCNVFCSVALVCVIHILRIPHLLLSCLAADFFFISLHTLFSVCSLHAHHG